MTIAELEFPTRILCIDDWLPEADAQKVLQECIDLKKVYMPAKVFDGPNESKVNTAYRRNDVVYLNDVFRSAPERSDILETMRKHVWSPEMRALWAKGGYLTEIINTCNWVESVLSRYGNCDFYGKHKDTRPDNAHLRLMTLVYYVNKEPEKFSGGALTFWDGEKSLKVAPKHNRLVVFPSTLMHEVENTRVEDDDTAFENGRFSLNYWLGYK